KSRHDQACHQGGGRRRAKRERLQPQSQPADAGAERGRGQADDDRPPELRYGRRAEVRQARDGQGKGAQPGPGVQPDEDERARAPAPSGAATRRGPTTAPPARAAPNTKNARRSGDRSGGLRGANFPAEARTAVAWSGTSRRAARRASTTRPPPMAIRGASGPS